MRTTLTRAAGVALAAATALTLSACGGDSDETSTPATSTTTASSESSAASDTSSEAAPSTESATSESATSEAAPSTTESSTEAATTSDSSTESGGGDAGDKPSKADVTAGMKKFYSTQNVAGSELLDMDKFADCMVNKGYDNWGNGTLSAISKGSNVGIDTKDAPTFAKYGSECGPQSLKAGAAPTS